MNVALLLEMEAYFYCFRKNQKNSLIRNSVHVHVVSEDQESNGDFFASSI